MEFRDLYDANKNVTGKTFMKGEQIPDGYFYLIVAIFIENSKGEFLLQKRVERKGGQWSTTSGHPKAGENSLEGILEEAREELGIDLSNEKLELFETWVNKDQFFDIYYLKKDITLDEITIQEEEVDGVKWASIEEIESLNKQGMFEPKHYIMFKKCLEYLNK